MASTLLHSLRIILMSTGILFIATILTPHIFKYFTASQRSLRSFLRPPYLYVIINGIIITIAASSRRRRRHHHHKEHPDADQLHRSPLGAVDNYAYSAPIPDPSRAGLIYGAVSWSNDETEVADVNETAAFGGGESRVVQVEESKKAAAVLNNYVGNDHFAPAADVDPKESKTVVSTKKATPKQPPQPAPLARQGTLEIVSSFFESQVEKPSPSARFAHRRKPAAQDGRPLRVAKLKCNDTLENTWKAITDGRRVPLTKHLKKSDTWENHSRPATSSCPSIPPPMKKSETFRDRSNHSPMSTRLKKDPSLSQDELNRRVEAFINKFNEDMRLQRQESIQQFKEMINRAAY